MWRNVVACDQHAGQGNDLELTATVTLEIRHSVDGPTRRDFSSIYIVRGLWGPEVESRSRFFQKSCLLRKNDPLRGNFQKFAPKGFIATQIHVLFADFVKSGRPEVDEIVRSLPDKKKTKNFRSLALTSAPIGPKISHGQRQTMYSECPNFHPNRFMSGGVIAERVNTIQTRHKVFPILGKTTASSPSNNIERNIKNILYILDKAVVTITVLLLEGYGHEYSTVSRNRIDFQFHCLIQ